MILLRKPYHYSSIKELVPANTMLYGGEARIITGIKIAMGTVIRTIKIIIAAVRIIIAEVKTMNSSKDNNNSSKR